MQDQWFRTGDGFLVVYSVINKKSFLEINNLRQRVLRVQELSNVPMVLVSYFIHCYAYHYFCFFF